MVLLKRLHRLGGVRLGGLRHLRRPGGLRGRYPAQFWMLFSGNFVSTIGLSMIWPFMMIYASRRLQLPLTAVASLLTINSAFLLAGTFLAGSLADRVGRRGIMIVGMALHGTAYLLFSFADSVWMFALLMALGGFVTPVYRVGVDAMVADLIPEERRVSAFAVLRMGNNAGVAIGPSIGGFLATQSYSIIFYCAAAGLLAYSLFTFLFVKETIPRTPELGPVARERFGGYLRVARDRVFVAVCGGFIIVTIGASLMFVLLAVYAKTQFGLPESRFGFIMATNAAMVVVFQVMVTAVSRRFRPYRVMALGTLLYVVGVGSVALGSSFLTFLASMVVLTVGELLLVPTTSALVANLAPPDMRGRYMSIYGLSWGIAAGIGPVFGGILNDAIAPRAIWVGGALVCLAGFVVFAALALREGKGTEGAEPSLEKRV